MQRKPFTPPYKARRIQRERVSDCDALIRAGFDRSAPFRSSPELAAKMEEFFRRCRGPVAIQWIGEGVKREEVEAAARAAVAEYDRSTRRSGRT